MPYNIIIIQINQTKKNINLVMNTATRPNYKSLLANGALVVDVRTIDEYNSGHVAGSVNIPLDTINLKLAELVALKKPIITVCRSGARSGIAAAALQSAGVEVYNGGGWDGLEQLIK